jgi:D-serine dehydratase
MTRHEEFAGADSAFVRSILDMELDSRSKGIPVTDRTVRLGDVGRQGWNVLRGDMMFPLLTVRQERMRNNLRVMRDYADFHGVGLAPHGKSTVCPQLYIEQMTVGGCWGITAATVQQAAVVAATGIENIIIANQVVSRANVEQLVELKRKFPGAVIFTLVDSPDTVEQLVAHGRGRLAGFRFQVLLEVGYVGGRTGVRTRERARDVIAAIARHADLIELCGVECYEGTINKKEPDETIAAVDAFLDFAVSVLGECKAAGAFGERHEILLTAGGSAYFDRVVEKFTDPAAGQNIRVVLRGGSYLTYDHGFYETKLRQLDARGGLEGPHGHVNVVRDFTPALELWAVVQSLQDPGVAIMAMGIRDLPYDLGYPRPLRQYRQGRELRDLEAEGAPLRIVNSNDQHCYLEYPVGVDIAVGDLLACGISHPCTAFDKWDVLYAVDEDFNVLQALKTFF